MLKYISFLEIIDKWCLIHEPWKPVLIISIFAKDCRITSALLILISRYGVKHRAQIARMDSQHLDSMEESLLETIRDMYTYIGPTNIPRAPVVRIYTMIKIVRQN